MSNKIKTIVFVYPCWCGTEKFYKVDKITDSVDFIPGQTTTKKEVEELCASKEWKVTVIGNK